MISYSDSMKKACSWLKKAKFEAKTCFLKWFFLLIIVTVGVLTVGIIHYLVVRIMGNNVTFIDYTVNLLYPAKECIAGSINQIVIKILNIIFVSSFGSIIVLYIHNVAENTMKNIRSQRITK